MWDRNIVPLNHILCLLTFVSSPQREASIFFPSLKYLVQFQTGSPSRRDGSRNIIQVRQIFPPWKTFLADQCCHTYGFVVAVSIGLKGEMHSPFLTFFPLNGMKSWMVLVGWHLIQGISSFQIFHQTKVLIYILSCPASISVYYILYNLVLFHPCRTDTLVSTLQSTKCLPKMLTKMLTKRHQICSEFALYD